MSKKKLLSLSLVVIMIAILSLGSLAWFSDSDEVENEFLIAGSDDQDPDDIFSVDVFENYDSNGDGTDEEYQEGIIYEDILPGDKLQKEAFVKNTGYYDQYVRVIVTISDATAWLNAVGEDINMENVFVGYNADAWTNIEKKIEGETDTVTYVLYYAGVLKGDEEINLFTGVNIPTSLTQEQAAAFGGDFTIGVKAQAVQTENVGANAYEAFQTVGMAY